LSENKNDTYFADGVQDEILSNLAKVAQLRVISRTSVMNFRSGSTRDLRSIATALNVAHVLEGTVRRNGNRVRITTELIDAKTDRTLWSDSYDRDLSDIFAIQSEIAQAVVSRLSAKLTSEERKGLAEKPASNLEAYDLYLQAKASISNSIVMAIFGETRQLLLDAIALLEKTIRLDSTFALAYYQIALADCALYVLRLDYTPDRRIHYDAAVHELLRLRPDLPEAHLAAGYNLYVCYRNFEKARAHLAIAERLLPNSADALCLAGFIDRGQGHWAESTNAFELACDLDPENPLVLTLLAGNYGYVRQYRDQKRIFARLIALHPDNPVVKLRAALVSFDEKADLSEWRTVLEALPPSMKNEANMFQEFVYFFVCSREWSKARELVKIAPSENFLSVLVRWFLVGAWRSQLQNFKENIRKRMLNSKQPEMSSHKRSKNRISKPKVSTWILDRIARSSWLGAKTVCNPERIPCCKGRIAA
jgi:adenylate cyclase